MQMEKGNRKSGRINDAVFLRESESQPTREVSSADENHLPFNAFIFLRIFMV